MSATILKFPVERVKPYGGKLAENLIQHRIIAETYAAHRTRHAQQGEEIDAFTARMEALEDLFRCGE